MERLDAPAERSGRSSRSFPTKRRRLPRRRALVAAAFVPAALGLLALILTVGAVQTVGAAILPGCLGFRAAVLKVRIHLPPRDSPCLAGYSPPTSKSRAFPAGVRGGAGSAVGRDGCGAVIRRRRAAISLAGRIPVPQRG